MQAEIFNLHDCYDPLLVIGVDIEGSRLFCIDTCGAPPVINSHYCSLQVNNNLVSHVLVQTTHFHLYVDIK